MNTLVLILFACLAFANERIRPEAELLREGYLPARTSRDALSTPLPSAHSLPWPVSFEDREHSIGNSMAEFQPFGAPYFHGGCDLRTAKSAILTAPVSGKIEAGHYSYDTLPDGSLKKYWKAWPQRGDPYYFEVAVVAEDGIRYELHHVARETLPPNIVQLLNAGGGRVAAGTELGRVIPWPDGVYHHTHYNVELPGGTRVNPEFVSPLLPDNIAPEILGIYAKFADGRVAEFKDGNLAAAPAELIVDVLDKQNENIYEHPPVLARLVFDIGKETIWDFRSVLRDANGAFPRLWAFFLESLRTPRGETIETEGGYGTGHSLIRLAIPAGAHGPFTLELGDIAGNFTKIKGTIAGK